MSKYSDILAKYNSLNETAEKGGTVFFGADWLSEIPIAELAREYTVYNRSVKGLEITDAEKAVDSCVFQLKPAKVFINIGENDTKNTDFSKGEFKEKYEWLLYSINTKCNCSLYIMSVVNDKTDKVNKVLKELCGKHGCEYIDITDCRSSFSKFFSKIRFFLLRRPITFYEAMNM